MPGLGSYFTSEPSVAVAKKEDLAVAVESQVNEVLLAAVETDTIANDVASLEEISTSLEGLADIAEQSIEDGGLDRVAGALLQQGVDNQMKRLGVDESITPSQEAFGGAGERSHNTQVSVEAIKDTVQSIWKSIKDAMKKLWMKVKEWWVKLTDAIPGIKKRAESIKEKAENTNGTAEENKIDIGSLAKALHVNGKVGAVQQTLKEMDDFSREVSDFFSKHTAEGMKDLASEITGVDDIQDQAGVNKAFANIKNAHDMFEYAGLNKAMKLSALTGDKRYNDKANSYFHSPEVAGGKALVVTLDTATLKDVTFILPTAKEKIRRYEVSLVTLNPKKSVSEAEVDTLSTSAVISACDQVIEGCDYLKDRAKNYGKIQAAKDSLLKAAEKAGNTGTKDKLSNRSSVTTTVKDLNKILSSLFTKIPNTVDRVATQQFSHAVETYKAVLSYCEKSLAQYKED